MGFTIAHSETLHHQMLIFGRSCADDGRNQNPPPSANPFFSRLLIVFLEFAEWGFILLIVLRRYDVVLKSSGIREMSQLTLNLWLWPFYSSLQTVYGFDF
jgi:hypothetical protein